MAEITLSDKGRTFTVRVVPTSHLLSTLIGLGVVVLSSRKV